MKIVRLLLSLMVLALTASFLISCESSKIAYGNTYYFKQTPKKTATPPAVQEETQLMASSIEQASPEISSIDEKVSESLTHVVALAKGHAVFETSLRSQKKDLTHAEKKSIRQERKENKREMRKELKMLVRDYRSAPQAVKDKMSVKEVTGNVRTGIIIGVVGLILLIIGGGTALYTIGSILVVVGLVLILIDLL